MTKPILFLVQVFFVINFISIFNLILLLFHIFFFFFIIFEQKVDNLLQTLQQNILLCSYKGNLAGLARFELAHARVKVWCLTAWLQPNIYWGGRWDSNPRSSVPQTDALTNYATSTIVNSTFHTVLFYFKSFKCICQDIFKNLKANFEKFAL